MTAAFDYGYDLKVQLRIFGFSESPDNITQILGVEPTDTAIKGQHLGERHPNATVKFSKESVVRINNWWLESQVDYKTSTIEDQLNGLLPNLRSVSQQLSNLPKDAEIALECFIDCHQYDPFIPLGKYLLEELNSLNIDFHIP
jgi:hypothetical protein